MDWSRSNSSYQESSPKIHLHLQYRVPFGFLFIGKVWYCSCEILISVVLGSHIFKVSFRAYFRTHIFAHVTYLNMWQDTQLTNRLVHGPPRFICTCDKWPLFSGGGVTPFTTRQLNNTQGSDRVSTKTAVSRCFSVSTCGPFSEGECDSCC